MKKKIYITRKIPYQIVNRLRHICDVRMWEEEDTPVPREILEQEVKDIDGLFCLLTETIDVELLNKANNLKIISNMAVGYNNIDINTTTKRGIMVTNTPDVLTETTADLTFALLMATARRMVEASAYLKNGEWKTWSPMQLTGQDIHGTTLGIVGLGRIGEAVVKRAKGFNMDVIYHNRSRKYQVEKDLDIKYVEFNTLLIESDYICIMTPLTPETRNLIDADQFRLMKETAILINTARGGIVNESALYNALVNKEIWAAGLDVFEHEPVSLDHPLLHLPNVVTLPHIGSASVKTRLRMANLAATNLLKGLTNVKTPNLVNKPLIVKN